MSWFPFGYPMGIGQLVPPLFPITNRQSLGLFLGTRWGVWKDAPGLFWGPRFESKQTKCAVWDAMRGSVVQQMVIKFTN